MPPAEEKLPEKIPFDVYGMMLILGFLATAGSIAFLHDELHTHWYADVQVNEQGQPVREFAVHLTTFNDAPVEPGQSPVEVPIVTDTDKKEWEILTGEADIPSLEEWPAWGEPIKHKYDPSPDAVNLGADKIPDEVWQPEAAKYVDPTLGPDEGGGAAAPAAGGAEAPAPAPAPAPEGGAAPAPEEKK